MVPTLLPGDRLLVDRGAYRRSHPAVGDIAVLLDPEGSRLWLIKRVVGVGPGRFWQTRSGLVAASPDAPETARPSDAIEAITLPDSTVYVTGDGATAHDSRHFGPVPVRALVGRAYYRYAPPNRSGPL
jgi:signal peptidase I